MSCCHTYCNKCGHLEPNRLSKTCVKCGSSDVDTEQEIEPKTKENENEKTN